MCKRKATEGDQPSGGFSRALPLYEWTESAKGFNSHSRVPDHLMGNRYKIEY